MVMNSEQRLAAWLTDLLAELDSLASSVVVYVYECINCSTEW